MIINTILKEIGSQFRKPQGWLGKIIMQIMIKGNEPAYVELLKQMNIGEDERIFEIGYGPGMGIFGIVSSTTNTIIDGIDFSEIMYRRAIKFNRTFIDQKRVDLQFGDFRDMPVPAKKYNRVFCINVIYFWNELHDPFEKAYELLLPGGIFYLLMARKETLDEHKFTVDEVFNKYPVEFVLQQLNEAGFKQVQYIQNDAYIIWAVK